MLFRIIAMSVCANHQVPVGRNGALGCHFVMACRVMFRGLEVEAGRLLQVICHFFVIVNVPFYC